MYMRYVYVTCFCKTTRYKPTTKKFGAAASTFEETYSRKLMANTSLNASAIVHPQPSTLYPRPQTLNPQPSIQNLKP